MKKAFKAFGLLLLIALVAIQFFRPEKNLQKGISTTHFSTKYAVPADVNAILDKACYDCHSNNSRYPWYFNIQPIGMWMDDHIKEGKQGLNFSEYTNKRLRYQYHKMEEVIEVITEDAMPIDSYTWTHKDAILTIEEKSKLKNWAQSIMDTLEAQYPIDSLKRQGPPPPQK